LQELLGGSTNAVIFMGKGGEVVYRGIASRLFLSDLYMGKLNWVRKGGGRTIFREDILVINLFIRF